MERFVFLNTSHQDVQVEENARGRFESLILLCIAYIGSRQKSLTKLFEDSSFLYLLISISDTYNTILCLHLLKKK